MREELRKKITKNMVAIKRDIDAKNFIDLFIEEGLLSIADEEAINCHNPNTAENRNLYFLRILLRKEDRAYDVFLQALRTVGLDHLVDQIDNTQVEMDPALNKPLTPSSSETSGNRSSPTSFLASSDSQSGGSQEMAQKGNGSQQNVDKGQPLPLPTAMVNPLELMSGTESEPKSSSGAKPESQGSSQRPGDRLNEDFSSKLQLQ